MTRHVIGKLDEFPDDTRRVVDIDGEEVAVFNVRGAFHAMRNACPHKGAPLCTLPPTGMMVASAPDVYEWGREGEIVRCPWHRWEVDITSGAVLTDPTLRVKRYEVRVEDGHVVLEA